MAARFSVLMVCMGSSAAPNGAPNLSPNSSLKGLCVTLWTS